MGNWFSKPWNMTGTESSSSSSNVQFTVFISHSGEDKATIAIPLRERLLEKGITAFVDEPDMPPGTEARPAMKRAMETAKIAVIVLSPEFVVKEWPMKELLCFLKRRKEYMDQTNSTASIPIILPFFYRLSISESRVEPRLDRRNRDGVLLHEQARFLERQQNGEPEADVDTIRAALDSLHGIIGVENVIDADNDTGNRMTKRRNYLLDELFRKICKLESTVIQLETSRDSTRGRISDSQSAEQTRFVRTGRTSTSASQVDGEAIYNLALEHEIGSDRMERNVAEAERLYRQAITVDNTKAMRRLARMLTIAAHGVERNAVEAVELYRRAAEKGDVDAMCELAAMLECGAEDVHRDAVQACELYRRAIELNNDDAMCSLAMMLENGAEGVSADVIQAEQLYRQAAEVGNVDAMYNLGRMLTNGTGGMQRNAVEAAEWYRRAVEEGHVNAMFSLALMLENGCSDVERDAVQAQILYRRAIDAGHVGAFYNLARMLAYGAEGVERNVVEAENWYRRAVDTGDVRAMYELAKMLEKRAEDVEQDSVEAVNLYRRAIRSGHVGAMFNLARMLTFGVAGVKKNAVEAETLYRLASDGGHIGALYSLAVMLTNGAEGVERNLEEAEQLLKRYHDDESYDREHHEGEFECVYIRRQSSDINRYS